VGLVPAGTFGGRDHRTSLGYKSIVPRLAWRIQHLGLWGKYAMERENMRNIEAKSLNESGLQIPKVDLRDACVHMAKKLPADLEGEINEVYLSHGSKPDILVAILSGGLNERFSGGLFGQGTYFAEDVAKNDQYCTPDAGAQADIKKTLFDELGIEHPGVDLYYVFVCRVLLGHFVKTQDGKSRLDGGGSIWSSEKRELCAIPGSKPPLLHHSLIAETGKMLMRFREFIVYHGDRIYPEYLVAYERK